MVIDDSAQYILTVGFSPILYLERESDGVKG